MAEEIFDRPLKQAVLAFPDDLQLIHASFLLGKRTIPLLN